MKTIRALKYLSVFSIPLTVCIAFESRGWTTFLPFVYVFGLVPLLELFFKPQTQNLTHAEEEMAGKDPVYDWLLYLMVPLQYSFVLYFVVVIQEEGLSALEILGRTISMGLLCGIIGINVAHELGHRTKWYEKLMAKTLLLTSLYMHFFIEHNRGHHRHVATPEDPASARYGETLFAFWLRSVWGSYCSAWHLESERLQKKSLSFFSVKNEMIQFTVIQLIFLAIIYLTSGTTAFLAFIAAACIGFLLLETVNYIEHYGLSRQQKENGGYERTQPAHSWNSNHIIGRMLLFELSRHSDHHFIASRKYQVLRHYENAPQMPTGYPGMMLLSFVPPLWFKVMHPKI